MAFKDFFGWCKRHLLLVTLLAIAFVVVFGFVNIQILHMTSEPEFCAMCHPKHGFGPLAEVDSWEHSGHGKAGVSCLDCHGRPGVLGYVKAKIGGLRDTYMQLTISSEEKLKILSNPEKELVPPEHCLFCHSDEGNRKYREEHKGPMKLVEMRLLDNVQNPAFRQQKGLPDILSDTFVGGTHFDHSFHIDSFEMLCADCHFGVVHRAQSKTDRMNLCLVCHAENQGSSAPQLKDCTTCHEAQLAMNEGNGAKGVEGEAGIMYAAGVDCQQCHTGVETGAFRPTSATCVTCHDASYIEVFDDWAKATSEEVERLGRERVEVEHALKRADEIGRNTAANWEVYEKAVFNLKFVKNDGTKGVHNRDYAEAVLKSVEADFQSIMKNLSSNW
jgi:nitrate/TMAO reductase-like tetraheme cytochrome c subunit